MPRPLRVLHVIPSVSPRDGGPTRAIGIMERALGQAGVEVTTLTTDHDLGTDHLGSVPAFEGGARRIYARKWLTPYKVAPGVVPRLLDALGEHDIVHIHALFSFTSTATAWTALIRDVPYVVRPLGTLSEYGLRTRRRWLKRLSMSLVERRILTRAAAVHFTSHAELADAGNIGLPLRGIVIPLGVDPPESHAVAPLVHETLSGRRVILFLSRLDPKKNVEALVDAVASSQQLRASCALLIAGSGEPSYVARLKAKADAAGLSGCTVWLGHIEGAEKQAALAAADVFVLPSYAENFGIAAVEALCAGTPCVLSNGVAVANEIEKAGAGLVVAPEPREIARALERLLGPDQALARAMALRARDTAARHFSAQAMAQRLIALYETIARPGQHATRWAQ